MKHQYTPMKRAMMVFLMNSPEISAVMDSIDELPDDLKSLYTERNGKFELTGIKGVQTDANVKRLEEGIRKEREQTKLAKEKLAKFGDMDPEEVHQKLDRITELEALVEGKVDDKKINELVEARIKSRISPLERKLQEAEKKAGDLEQQVNGFVTEKKQRTIKDIVTTEARKAKILDTAMDDVVLNAERIFELSEDGKVVAKDNVGVTPGVDPSVWLQEIQARRPHWWAPSQGGGGTGGGGNTFGNNPWSNEHWNMTEQGKMLRENPTKAEQMAKSAGTKVGGPRPVKK